MQLEMNGSDKSSQAHRVSVRSFWREFTCARNSPLEPDKSRTRDISRGFILSYATAKRSIGAFGLNQWTEGSPLTRFRKMRLDLPF